MVRKSDWETVEMPLQVTHFVIEKDFSKKEMRCIKRGFRPQEMEDKWFLCYSKGKLYCYRSWTGYCIFIIDFSEKGKLHVTANRNPEQWTDNFLVTDDENLVSALLKMLVTQNAIRKD